MKLVPHIRFEDPECDEFQKIASPSILCDTQVEDRRDKRMILIFRRLSVVRMAAQGDLMSPRQVEELMDALANAIEDRHQVVADLAEHPELVKTAESYYEPLRRCLALAEQARIWVGAPEQDDDEGT